MSKRQKLWASRKKVEQLAQLGGVCVSCGSNENLERDCITPRGDEHHKMSTDQRATFYAREIKAGNVQLLCKDCHTKKTVVDIRNVERSNARTRHATEVKELLRRRDLVTRGQFAVTHHPTSSARRHDNAARDQQIH